MLSIKGITEKIEKKKNIYIEAAEETEVTKIQEGEEVGTKKEKDNTDKTEGVEEEEDRDIKEEAEVIKEEKVDSQKGIGNKDNSTITNSQNKEKT